MAAKRLYAFTVRLEGVVEGSVDEVKTVCLRQAVDVPEYWSITENEWDAMNKISQACLVSKTYDAWLLANVDGDWQPWNEER